MFVLFSFNFLLHILHLWITQLWKNDTLCIIFLAYFILSCVTSMKTVHTLCTVSIFNWFFLFGRVHFYNVVMQSFLGLYSCESADICKPAVFSVIMNLLSLLYFSACFQFSSITVLTCVTLVMKISYVVSVFVFLHYMSVEYIAQVLEKLAASVWRVGVCRKWYCSDYADRGLLRATGLEQAVVQSGPFQLPNLVDRKHISSETA